MKNLLLRCAAIALTVYASGCRSVTCADETLAAPRAGEALVQALVKNDADAFLAQLPREVSETFDVKSFRATRESLTKQVGEPVSYEFAMNLAHPKFTLSVWLIHCERKSSDGKETIRQDMLFRVVFGKLQDNKEHLLQFQFL